MKNIVVILFLITPKLFSQEGNQLIENKFKANTPTDPVVLTLGCSKAKFYPQTAKKGGYFHGKAEVPYTDGNGNSFGEFSAESTGVLGLTASLEAGTLVSGDENFNFTITGTPKSSGTAYFLISVATISCTMSLKVEGR